MTTNMDEYDFAASSGAEVAEKTRAEGDFQREVEFLSLDATPAGVKQGRNSILLRFLTNLEPARGVQMTQFNLGWITVQGHYAPTKPKPEYAREGQKWPAKMGSGCRKDKVFVKKFADTCYICESIGSKSSPRTWALAVEREEVRGEADGRILGYRDKTREIFDTDANGDLIVLEQKGEKKTYQKKIVPAYVVMSMGWKNFFQPLKGQATYFGSLLDADWLITREGTESDNTSYTPVRVAQQQVPADNPFGLPEGAVYDLGAPGVMEKVYPEMPDLRRIIADRVSDEYFGRFFVPGWLPEGFDPNAAKSGSARSTSTSGMMMMTSAGAPAQAPQSAPTEEPPSEALAALKNRIQPNR